MAAYLSVKHDVGGLHLTSFTVQEYCAQKSNLFNSESIATNLVYIRE
jgi:hypothetical protein